VEVLTTAPLADPIWQMCAVLGVDHVSLFLTLGCHLPFPIAGFELGSSSPWVMAVCQAPGISSVQVPFCLWDIYIHVKSFLAIAPMAWKVSILQIYEEISEAGTTWSPESTRTTA
jgi:hypothetical protein